MNITDLFTRLSYGELTNLWMSSEGNGDILEEKKPAVIQYANEGLLRLHTRFILKEKDVLIEQVSHITNYHLIEKFTESRAPQPDAPYPYIKDLSREQFVNDIIKIHAVYEGGGCQLPLNDAERYDSVFTPQQNVLQVPFPVTGVSLGILYQAKHATLNWEEEETDIEIPEVLESALLAFIGYRVYSGIASPEASVKAQEHLSNYESVCQEVIDRDLVNSSVSTTNVRFGKGGWI